jgi:POT family proton-dependent oligopeptide transporter
MGINLGALLAPLVTGTLIGAYFGFKWGFFAAGIGMILSTVFLEFAKPSLGKVGLPPEGKESWNRFFAVGLGAVAAVPVIYFLLSESAILGIILLNVMAFVIFYFFSSAHKSAAISALIGLALWLGAQFYFSDGEIGVQSLRDNAFSQMPMIIWGVYVLVTAISLLVKKFAAGDKVQAQRYIAMVILFVANACFWSLFEQAGSSLNFLARDFVTPIWGTMESWQAGGFAIFQSLNPLFILIFAPLFAMLWPVLDKKGINPSIPRKFALGLLQVGLGFGVLIWAIANFQNAAGLVPWIFLGLCYLLHTTGELCLSPIGLSMVTKLAAPKEVGLAMGGWFLSIAMAQYVAGIIAAIASGGDGGHGVAVSSIEQYASTYQLLLYIGLGFGVLYLVLAPAINKLMHGVK